MNTKKATKRALLTSVMALVMCVVMLVGTTFAWFTDTAFTGVNKIQAGNLNIELQMKDNEGNWVNAEGKTLPFLVKGEIPAEGTQILWEPGCTYYVPEVRVLNKGNLAVKFEYVPEALGVTGKLAEVLELVFKTPVDNEGNDINIEPEVLKPGEASPAWSFGYHMLESAGNEYQKATATGMCVTVVATQATYENDSFGNTYDAGAAASEFKQGVTISGIAGVAESYDTIQDAYEAVKAMLVANSGLAEQQLSEDAFNAFFTDDGKITWTIYGNQKVTDVRMFSFGRAANRFGDGRQIKEIDIIGGNSSAALDLTAVNGTFALPYNHWNVVGSFNTALKCKNITFNGITNMPAGRYAENGKDSQAQCTLYATTYEFDGCTFNGNLYSYQNYDVNMTIKNCTFNAPAATKYAFMSQGLGGTITLDNNVFNNYTRGVNFERATANFVFTNNTIVSTVSESDRGAIQLTDGKSFVVTGNTVDVNAGNAFWFHNAATNAGVTYTISNNDIKAPYIGYSGVTAFDVNTKITSSDNKFNSTDITSCMKKGKTVAEATNLTAIR